MPRYSITVTPRMLYFSAAAPAPYYLWVYDRLSGVGPSNYLTSRVALAFKARVRSWLPIYRTVVVKLFNQRFTEGCQEGTVGRHLAPQRTERLPIDAYVQCRYASEEAIRLGGPFPRALTHHYRFQEYFF